MEKEEDGGGQAFAAPAMAQACRAFWSLGCATRSIPDSIRMELRTVLALASGDRAPKALLAAEAIVVIERSARSEAESERPGLSLRGTKRYGETAFDWWEFAAEPAAESEALA